MPKIMSRTLAPLYPLLCLCALSTPAMAEPGREPSPASAIPRVLMGTPPVNVNTSAAGSLPKNLFFSALNVSFADKTHAEKGGAARSDVFGQTWLLKLRYGLTDHVEFVAITPYIDQSRSHPTPSPKHLGGWGDQVIGINAAPFNLHQGDPFALSFSAAVLLPTGQEGKRHLPGNGAWGWRVGAAYGRFLTPNLKLDTEGVWSGPFERGNQEVKRGQSWQWNSQLRYLFHAFDLGLESSLVHQKSAHAYTPAGKVSTRNGVTEWFVGPSLNIVLPADAWLGIGVFFPVHRHFDGPNKSENKRVELKIGKLW
ncbi:hypothetical protein AGMMS49543_09460 [Betaproteobacteria bacterium]|nr:hypothetical protein AGMMS49543_09460 [Betaproteobacteria bacterium]GHU17051.1 hypothetical protein AGMMS50243_04590 [Betaproteobacteria bacterium]